MDIRLESGVESNPFHASRLDLEVQQMTDDRDSLRIG